MKLKVLIVYPNIPLMLVTPLAVATFVWIIRKAGHDVDIFDSTKYIDEDLSSPENRVKFLQARKTNLDSLDAYNVDDASKMLGDFEKKLDSYNPDLLLYSFTEDSLLRALDLLRISNKKNIPTVVGGILAISDPEWLIAFDEVSIIATGEGEIIVEEIVEAISKGKSLDETLGLWIKQSDGTIKKNQKPEYVTLDDYSTDFSFFDDERFIRPMGGKVVRAIPIETYRGCPMKCTYCNSPLHNTIARSEGRTYLRRRSIEGIRKEMKHLINDYDINFFYIVDDDFLARPNAEIYEFIEMYKDINIPFWMNTRAEHVTIDILQKLHEVGMYRVSFGVESGSESFRREYLGRGASNEKLLEKFDIINQSKVDYSVNVILGFPYETRDKIFETIDFCKKIKGYDSLTASIFTPYRGTVLREMALKEGWLDPNELTKHTTSTSMLKMPHLTSENIDGLMKTVPLYVEFDEEHWDKIEKIESFQDKNGEIEKYYHDLYNKVKWDTITDE